MSRIATQDPDIDAALAAAYGADSEPAHEVTRRGRAERKMAVRADDGRTKKATGRTQQFNVMVKPPLKAEIAKAAHRAGHPHHPVV
jgi:hypothetical protein